MTEVVSARLNDDLLALLDEVRGDDSRAAWVSGLIEAELLGAEPPQRAAAAPDRRNVTHEPPPGGIASPGALCMWPHCMARNTSRFGVTDAAELVRTDYADRPRDPDKAGLPLCPAHAALLAGLVYRRHARAATLPGA